MIVAAAVRPDLTDWAREQFGGDIVADYNEVLARDEVNIVAPGNENDRKAEIVLASLRSGRDVVGDKPLALTRRGQKEIEATPVHNPNRRLLMVLTLRGRPVWAALRGVVRDGRIGTPAFTSVRTAVRLKRAQRPPWFLDVPRSDGLFLDLLVHALDQGEWITGRRIAAVTANMDNLGDPGDPHLRDHAAVCCELDDGGAAVVEGQRMPPDTKASDYRVTVAGTKGYADPWSAGGRLTATTAEAADEPVSQLPEPVSVVEDWLNGGELVGRETSLRANRLALPGTAFPEQHRRSEVT